MLATPNYPKNETAQKYYIACGVLYCLQMLTATMSLNLVSYATKVIAKCEKFIDQIKGEMEIDDIPFIRSLQADSNSFGFWFILREILFAAALLLRLLARHWRHHLHLQGQQQQHCGETRE